MRFCRTMNVDGGAPLISFRGSFCLNLAVLSALSATTFAASFQVAGLEERHLSACLAAGGLTPESLASAGVNPNETTAIIAAGASAMGQDVDAFAALIANYKTRRGTVEQLERRIRAGQGNTGDLTDLDEANTLFATAETELSSYIASVRSTALTPLSGGKRSLVEEIVANLPHAVPAPFKVTERTEDQWVGIRDALANERHTHACGASPDEDCQDLLESVRGEGAVADAIANLDQGLGEVASAYLNAIAILGE